ncbi:hypothetical protein SVAN01_08147 [Stagonosporopsis vannaccii]|nr:hypothetical protein SVAN01_08147 [Stagonosporopsis vannaccii]
MATSSATPHTYTTFITDLLEVLYAPLPATHFLSTTSTCPICYDNTPSPTVRHTTACTHALHTSCLTKWFESLLSLNHGNTLTCPLCRAPATMTNVPDSTEGRVSARGSRNETTRMRGAWPSNETWGSARVHDGGVDNACGMEAAEDRNFGANTALGAMVPGFVEECGLEPVLRCAQGLEGSSLLASLFVALLAESNNIGLSCIDMVMWYGSAASNIEVGQQDMSMDEPVQSGDDGAGNKIYVTDRVDGTGGVRARQSSVRSSLSARLAGLRAEF